MKYALETLIVTLFCLLMYLIYLDNKVHEDSQYDVKIKSFEIRMDSLLHIEDSITIIDKSITKKITIINNYYDSSKVSILSISDSDQFILLFSNIKRFNYLLESNAGQSN
jgi:hypothetical protein